jgi:hypothetical protein
MKKYSIYLLLWILILHEAVTKDMSINTGSAHAYNFSCIVSDNTHELQNTDTDIEDNLWRWVVVVVVRRGVCEVWWGEVRRGGRGGGGAVVVQKLFLFWWSRMTPD